MSTVGMRATRRALTGIIAVVMVLGLAGCGGGDDDENALGAGGRPDLVITDMGFEPDEDFTARVGEEVSLRIANEDDRPHTFTLTFLDIEQEIPAGTTADVRFKITEVPQAGFYSFYSKNHQNENGYFGKIQVVQ